VQYRFTRRSTIGANYTYSHFGYHGIFSASDVHGVNGTYALQINRALEVSVFGGFSRAETKIVESVPTAPAIAILLGLPVYPQIIHSIGYTPTFSGRLSRTFSRGVLFCSGGRSVTPGNGLFLTSVATNALAGYAYTGLRRWSLSLRSAYFTAKSSGNILGAYGDVTGTLSASRQLFRYVHAVAAFTAVQYQSPAFNGYNRLTYNATLGLGFAPGDFPLRLW
jgi:hypothetical protein